MTYPVFGYSPLDGQKHVINHQIKDKLMSVCLEDLVPVKTKKQQNSPQCEYCLWVLFLNEES